VRGHWRLASAAERSSFLFTMTLFALKRVPEPEVMDESSEVAAYASAAAQSYLEKIDRTFVEHVARLIAKGAVHGQALDLGCGPGQIPIMMAARWPALRIVGLDAAPGMIAQARQNAAAAGVAISFQVFRAQASEMKAASLPNTPKSAAPERSGTLPFADHSFDLVTCNSVLHHLAEPVGVLNEIARVAKPSAAVLIRDLRRPAAPLFPLYVRWFGRKYSGEMRRLYEASVGAAYTAEELGQMLQRSALHDGRSRVFRHHLTHIGIERSALL
jgi:ubiquinone/menaquinone biosynthesis C-methylase UbiE